jgi:hypothetical protein
MKYILIDREKGFPTLINLAHVVEIRPTPKGVQINLSTGRFIDSNVHFNRLPPIFEEFLVNHGLPVKETQPNF